MIIICEECGKKYQIDPSRIKGTGAKAKCTACGNMMTIPKPEVRPEAKPVDRRLRCGRHGRFRPEKNPLRRKRSLLQPTRRKSPK